jgi:serine/threonine protein kinase
MLSPGTVIDGRYQIVAPLGSGGMGYVYRATRSLLGDEVAIKIMNAPQGMASDLGQRFIRESRACAQLRHPGIVSILDFNIDKDGQPFLVMELLSGPSLREELDLCGAMPVDRAVGVLTEVAAALQLAHGGGITHRDLKPANIVAHRYASGERVYKVIDFGLAAVKEATDVTRLTTPYMFIGTMAYASPEQLRGEAIDTRTDIYALGVIAYEMVAGRLPFTSENRMALMQQALNERPLEPSRHRPGIPARVDAAIMRALEKSPADRWQSVSEFVRELEQAADAELSRSPQTPEDTLLSRYELGKLAGRGRMASTVYLGTHRALGVPVAIRLLKRADQPNWEAVKSRFLIEARTLQVSHPSLLQVRDFGEDERLVYVVTDYVDGRSLRELLAAEGKLPWPRASLLIGQMLDATAALNARGGFIAGVNPDMIRVGRDDEGERIVLSTAGIRSVQDVLATMREQELRGEEANERELPYIAPEVLVGAAPAAAADVFTAGVLAYEMLTGALPFRARTLPELIGQMLHVTPADARTLTPELPEATSTLFAQCLLADPKQRIPSARVMLERL